ncbi:hypothetical protein JTB14_013425 [Gonioctena quinquepunctata]|nr:hypothetical protein JTB14_013425 [Gonioctena quinquepunctata]
MTPYDTPGLDDPVLARNDNPGHNVRAMTPQDLTGCPMPELSLQHQAIKEPMASDRHRFLSWSKSFKEFSYSIAAGDLFRIEKNRKQEAKKKEVSKRMLSEDKKT